MTSSEESEGLALTTNEPTEYKSRSMIGLMWLKFRQNRLAIVGLVIIVVLYGLGIFAEFFSPYDLNFQQRDKYDHPPQRLRVWDEEGGFHLRPFVYGRREEIDPKTLLSTWVIDKEQKYPVHFFVKGRPYKVLGFLPIEANIHLYGVKEGYIYLFGSDGWGRDMVTRLLYGARVSLTLGWIGVMISMILGTTIGILSGYLAGVADIIIQRIIEVFMSIPGLPLWMALAAAVPANWSAIQIYFAITVILSFVGWTGLARIVRGMVLSYRESEFVLAARNMGAGTPRIIFVHLMPNVMSYLIVSVTLAVPNMIIGETALSFLGIGLRPPISSWGVLLREAQNVNRLLHNPWYLIAGVFVIVAVLAFNFVGDGLRDAADPFSSR